VESEQVPAERLRRERYDMFLLGVFVGLIMAIGALIVAIATI
jgi:hypothetical protein